MHTNIRLGWIACQSKHSSLLRKFVIYGQNFFIALAPDRKATITALPVVVVGVDVSGEAEVGDLGHEVLVDEDVSGRKVAVNATP